LDGQATMSVSDPGLVELMGNQSQRDPCLALWRSRLAAPSDPPLARSLLSQAAGCQRREQVHLWAADLAWQQGDEASAKKHWLQLRPGQLLALGRSKALWGDRQQARAILELLADSGREQLRPEQQILLHQTRAEYVYRPAGDVEKTIEQLEQAWQLSEPQFNLAFQLGRAYLQAGRSAEAVAVLRAGLGHRPAGGVEQIDFFYQALLGQGLAATNEAGQALDHYRQAEANLRSLQPGLAHDVYQEWLAWLNRLRQQIDKRDEEADR
jgi:tetratricopeptide (TPR) repeat protein